MLDGRPFLRRIQVAVDDDVGDAEVGEGVEARFVWEIPQLSIEERVERGPQSAVALDGLLPVRRRVQHVFRVALFVAERHLRDHERRRLLREPSIDGGNLHAVGIGAQRHGCELRDEPHTRDHRR